jgi:hypothetical protein
MEKGSPYLGLYYLFNGSEGQIKLPRPRKYARSLDKPPNGLYPLEADPVYKKCWVYWLIWNKWRGFLLGVE